MKTATESLSIFPDSVFSFDHDDGPGNEKAKANRI